MIADMVATALREAKTEEEMAAIYERSIRCLQVQTVIEIQRREPFRFSIAKSAWLSVRGLHHV